MKIKVVQLFQVLMILFTVAACTSAPGMRSDMDPEADFGQFRSYGFVEVPGTDQAEYQTLVTGHFKRALRREMDARGYRYEETDPDLLLNFNVTISERLHVSNLPAAGIYYGYRGYGTWGGYGAYNSVYKYNHGTVNIDIVDARRRQLVWEGVAEGKMKESDLTNATQRIDRVVTLIMKMYPFHGASEGK